MQQRNSFECLRRSDIRSARYYAGGDGAARRPYHRAKQIPGILPGGMGVWFEKSLPFCASGPGGKLPPSTAAKMAAATDVNPTY